MTLGTLSFFIFLNLVNSNSCILLCDISHIDFSHLSACVCSQRGGTLAYLPSQHSSSYRIMSVYSFNEYLLSILLYPGNTSRMCGYMREQSKVILISSHAWKNPLNIYCLVSRRVPDPHVSRSSYQSCGVIMGRKTKPKHSERCKKHVTYLNHNC